MSDIEPQTQDVDASVSDAAGDELLAAGESLCEKKFFDERAEVAALLQQLVSAKLPSPESDVDAAFLQAHESVTQILDRYLEQSHLLDPYLHELVDPIVAEIQQIMRTRVSAMPNAGTSAFPFQVYRNPKLHKLFQLLYCLCKVRGYKTVVKVLPHEVADFEPTLHLLQCQDRSDHAAWETRYVLLLWLSMLCLVPFDLNTIDSSTGDSSSSSSPSIVTNIVTLCKQYLGDPGATQVAAAVCLSRLLSRPDMEEQHLTQFVTWANNELIRAGEGDDSVRSSQFRVTGVMLCLTHIAKHSPRDKHANVSKIYFATVMQLISRLTDDDSRSDRSSSSTLHRKLSVKLVQRLGLLYLPPRVRSWRYNRGLRSLELNLQSLGLTNESTSKTTATASNRNVDDDDDYINVDILGELEQIVEVLLCGLRDKDTIVRWSAAKGIGRITGRLPYEFADDIVQSVLELFIATEGDGAWHGASLALAELARRGVLLPQRLADAVQCVTNALQYDIRRTTHSIGSHVRDAACYACWSFARAYEPSLLLPWLKQSLAPAMLVNCVFDRELNCRRAASAAFQENVGRQGRTNFPHGIDLLTRADYFSVSNLRHAYADVSVFIARFPEYRYHLLDHLVSRKISHWDVQIRKHAAVALGKIGSLDPPHAMAHIFPNLLSSVVSPDIEVIERHGAALSIAELLISLAQIPVFLDGELQKTIKMVPIEIEKRRLFRGRGGEMIRAAVCGLIQVIACAHLSLGFAHVKRYLTILEECFVHPAESVREAAVAAFGAFTAQYCPVILDKAKNPDHVKFIRDIVPKYINSGIVMTVKENGSSKIVLNPNVAARRGYLRAIGVAAKELVQPLVKECVSAMIRSLSLSQQTGEEEDAESRVAAVRALTDFCARQTNRQLDLLGMEDAVVECLVQSITLDYRIDERGDVGSWIRREAMLGIERLFSGQGDKSQDEIALLVGQTAQTKYGPGLITGFVSRPSLTDADISSSASDPLYILQFATPAFGFYYFGPLGVGHLRRSQLVLSDEIDPLQSTGKLSLDFELPDLDARIAAAQDFQTRSTQSNCSSCKLPFGRRLSPELVGKAIAAISQQLAEKLDGMRLTAGSVLFNLIHASRPRIDGIPDRFALEERIFPRSLVVNWSMAHDTFPLVVQMLDLPDYMEAVASGIVLSVGGLTESVVKASQAALFDWIRGHNQAKNFGLLRRFAFFLVTLLTRHHQDDRVTIPLMKTIAVLLENNLLEFLFETNDDAASDKPSRKSSEFGSRLYDALRDEIQKCTAVPKLSAAISVLVGLLPSDNETENRVLKALLLFLAHRFPKVRKLTAERLYTRLLLDEEIIDEDKYDSALEILSETAWDAPIAHVREGRNQLLDLFDMERPQKKQRSEERDSAPMSLNANAEGYQTLIKEMGY